MDSFRTSFRDSFRIFSWDSIRSFFEHPSRNFKRNFFRYFPESYMPGTRSENYFWDFPKISSWDSSTNLFRIASEVLRKLLQSFFHEFIQDLLRSFIWESSRSSLQDYSWNSLRDSLKASFQNFYEFCPVLFAMSLDFFFCF